MQAATRRPSAKLTYDILGPDLECREREERTATIDVLSCLLSTGSVMDIRTWKRHRWGSGEKRTLGG
jgi:hypothetical protein